MALLFATPALVGGLRAPTRGATVGLARPAGSICRPRRLTLRAAATEDGPPAVAVPPVRPVVGAPSSGSKPPAEAGTQPKGGALAEVSDVDAEFIAARARQLVADVQERPGYYASVAGYATGAFVVFVVASAVVGALDRLPIIPSALQLIGLTYSGWFTYRYLLQEETREELKVIIDDLIGKTR
ncbi:hypothetical protein MMPV_003851 [Pyropia vietnamensis]